MCEYFVFLGKLKEGVTINRVWHDIRKTGTENNFERIHYADRKDFHNILRDFMIGQMSRYHTDDHISIDILIQQLRANEDSSPSPILHYDNTVDQFSLITMTEFQRVMLMEHRSIICIDGTHGMCSTKKNLQLFTLVLIDEFGNGLPAAFYFSQKADTTIMEFFLKNLRKSLETHS